MDGERVGEALCSFRAGGQTTEASRGCEVPQLLQADCVYRRDKTCFAKPPIESGISVNHSSPNQDRPQPSWDRAIGRLLPQHRAVGRGVGAHRDGTVSPLSD